MRKRPQLGLIAPIVCLSVLLLLSWVAAVLWTSGLAFGQSTSLIALSKGFTVSKKSLRKRDFSIPFIRAGKEPTDDLLHEIEEPFYMIPESEKPSLRPDPPRESELPFDSLYNIIDRWNPDNPDIPDNFKETLQHFDYGNPEQRAMAGRYRDAELPFKLYNISDFQEVSNKWTDAYLVTTISNSPRRSHVEKSNNNHFMFWSGRSNGLRNYVPPTQIISDMSYTEWLGIAKEADRTKLNNATEHYYFMAGADAHEKGRTFISRDIPAFSTERNNFFITNVQANKGIQCRFGMRGVIAEAHYDAGRNMVAMIKGAKRYILTPPWTCDHLGIIADTRHPSYRHSIIDWSDLNQCRQNKFSEVNAFDTVVHKGEILYIPSFWFHFIVSLKYSIQCNSRSGSPPGKKGYEHITDCYAKSPLKNMK